MFSCRSLARLMLRVKNPPEEGVKYVRLASPSANANHMHGFHLAVVVCVISYAHEIGILVPFTWCFYSAVTLANSTPLSKIAHDRYGFQFLASLNVSPSGSPLEKKQKKQTKIKKKKQLSLVSSSPECLFSARAGATKSGRTCAVTFSWRGSHFVIRSNDYSKNENVYLRLWQRMLNLMIWILASRSSWD